MQSAWHYTDDKQQIHNLKIANKHDTVSVLGKAYINVVEVADSVENMKIEYKYYAYGVGLIKIESLLIDPERIREQENLRSISPTYQSPRTVTFQLKSYSPKEPSVTTN